MHATGQARHDRGLCRPREAWQACYDRASALAIDSVRAARQRRDTTREARLLVETIPVMSEICDGGKLGAACYFAGRLMIATAINDTVAQRRSTELYQAGCLAPRPSAAACNGLGDAFAYGLGRKPSFDSALYYFHRGCVEGNATACARAGARYEQVGELGPATMDSSRRLSRLGCIGGSAIGCVSVASDLSREIERTTPAAYGKRRYEQVRDSAMQLDSAACVWGSRVGCTHLAIDYTRGFGRANPDSARFYYNLACVDSLPPATGRSAKRTIPVMKGMQQQGVACDNLGDLLLQNPAWMPPFVTDSGQRIVPPDRQAALAYYRLGCSALEPNACVDLARADSGLNATESLFLFTNACFNGSGYGCDNAGLQLVSRFIDTASAVTYLHRSCNLGDTNGCNNLGVVEERLDSQNVAMKYYRRACDADNKDGCHNLGLRLEFFLHMPELALTFYTRSCDLRDVDGCRRAIAAFNSLQRFDAEARYRTIICELSAAECKRKS